MDKGLFKSHQEKPPGYSGKTDWTQPTKPSSGEASNIYGHFMSQPTMELLSFFKVCSNVLTNTSTGNRPVLQIDPNGDGVDGKG